VLNHLVKSILVITLELSVTGSEFRTVTVKIVSIFSVSSISTHWVINISSVLSLESLHNLSLNRSRYPFWDLFKTRHSDFSCCLSCCWYWPSKIYPFCPISSKKMLLSKLHISNRCQNIVNWHGCWVVLPQWIGWIKWPNLKKRSIKEQVWLCFLTLFWWLRISCCIELMKCQSEKINYSILN